MEQSANRFRQRFADCSIASNEPHQTSRNKAGDLRVAPVYMVASPTGRRGNAAKALAGNESGASSGLRQTSRRIAGHGHFCGLFASGEAIEGREEAEMAAFDGCRSGPTDVSRTARFGNPGDESEWRVFRADGGAHYGIAAGAGAQFSGFRTAAGSCELVAAGIVGQAATFGGNKRASASDRGLRLDRA